MTNFLLILLVLKLVCSATALTCWALSAREKRDE